MDMPHRIEPLAGVILGYFSYLLGVGATVFAWLNLPDWVSSWGMSLVAGALGYVGTVMAKKLHTLLSAYLGRRS
jgi:hypothetical protein